MFEPLSKAESPAEMRAAIEAGQQYDPIIRNVLTMARYQGMSAEDTYTVLAYHALQTMVQYQQQCIELASLAPPRPLVISADKLAK